MSNLPEKIQTATQELRYLQRNIEGGAAAPKLAEIDMAAVREFKAVLDYVRQLVWNYIEVDTRAQGQDAGDEIRSLRLQRVTEMLQAIQQEAKVRQLTPSSATVSFLNAVQEIADQAFRKHLTSEGDIEKAS